MKTYKALLLLVLGLFLFEFSKTQETNEFVQQNADATEENLLVSDTSFNQTDKPKETIAQVLGDALREEFKHEEEQREADAGKQFNETLASKSSETTQETVIIIGQKKAAANRTETETADGLSGEDGGATSPSSLKKEKEGDGREQDSEILSLDAGKEEKEEEVPLETDVDRIIDSHDNEYVLSKSHDDGSMSLTLDFQFIRDLTVLVCSSAVGGLIMELLGQPTINGYFIAGSFIGPGGLDIVKEIVQVQSVAQLGVLFLLFTLGMEFSLDKLHVVRDVALIGGALQMLSFTFLGGFAGMLIGSSSALGAFLGALVGMSSTSVVVKCLGSRSRTIPGQITIGILVFQDCVVGLLFASMPVIARGLSASGPGSSQQDIGELAMAFSKVMLRIGIVILVAYVTSKTLLQRGSQMLARHADAEVIQMVAIGFCLACAMGTAKLGISAELGAFIAGVMVSSTEQCSTVLSLVESVAHIFLALFISSTGLILAPAFLFHHLPVLAAGVMIVILAKTLVIATTVALFRYQFSIALSVGMNLAQIGELAFVLLSLSTQRSLISAEVYLLAMGICALSLLVTPFLLQLSAFLLDKTAPGRPSSSNKYMSVEEGDRDSLTQYSRWKGSAFSIPHLKSDSPERMRAKCSPAASDSHSDDSGYNVAGGRRGLTDRRATTPSVAEGV